MEKVFYTNKVIRKSPTALSRDMGTEWKCISQCIFVMVILCVNVELLNFHIGRQTF